MTGEAFAKTHAAGGVRWRMVGESLTRPYRVTFSMVILVSLVPLYLFIPAMVRGPFNAPAMLLDGLIPLRPEWSLVYGSVYLFLILLPVLVVRQEEHIRRTVRAYLTVWLTAYVFFVIYPTVAPRPQEVNGEGFAVWGLLALYGSDPPYNCFPSLHVAHSFVSALTIHRLHRRLGDITLVCASLVGLSTLFTKQHYVADVIAGFLLAWAACAIFLRGYSRDEIPGTDQSVAPLLALCTAALITAGLGGFWVIYRFWM